MEEVKEEKKSQEQVKRTKLSVVADFIYAPTKFFEWNEEKSRFILPILLLMVSTVILTMITVPIAMKSQEVVAAVGDQIDSETFNRIAMITGTIGATIGVVISMLLVTLILLLCVKYIVKGEMTFKKMLSIYLFSQMPQILLNIICAIVYKITGHITTNLVTTIVMSINPLTIWSLVLLAIGIHVTSKASIKKCAILCGGFQVISLAMSIGSYLF